MTTKITSTKISKIRDHLANERTFLAWIRTGISIIVFGFVIAKFGITLRELLSIQKHTLKDSGISLSIGVGFMIMGIIMTLLAMLRYQITMKRIDTGQFKAASTIVILLGGVVAIFGAILTIYLIMTAQII